MPPDTSAHTTSGPATPSTATVPAATQTIGPPIRAEQVGSLLRPPTLMSSRRAHHEGRVADSGLRSLEDRVVLDSLEEQQRAGLQVFTDGQFRRPSWLGELTRAVDGFVPASGDVPYNPHGGEDTGAGPNVVGDRLHHHGRITAAESDFLRANAPGPFKITLPSPSSLALATWQPGVTDRAYESWAELMDDYSAIIGRELTALAEEGTPYLQLDAPGYRLFAHQPFRDRAERSGVDVDALLTHAIEADNRCVAALPRERVSLGVHLCRGSAPRHWLAAGGHEAMAEQLFTSLDFDVFLLEAETPWADGFKPLRYFSHDRIVVLGIVASKRPNPRPYPALVSRIHEAAAELPLDNLAVSPQCGFSSNAGEGHLTFDDQQRKLELVGRLAHDVWD